MKSVMNKVLFFMSVFFLGCNIQAAEVDIQQQEIIEQYIKIAQNDQLSESEILELMKQNLENVTFFDFTVEAGFLVLAGITFVGVIRCIELLDGVFHYRPPGNPRGA
jgi:hypothetical protein